MSGGLPAASDTGETDRAWLASVSALAAAGFRFGSGGGLTGPCPECGADATADPDAGTWGCSRCGRSGTVADLDQGPAAAARQDRAGETAGLDNNVANPFIDQDAERAAIDAAARAIIAAESATPPPRPRVSAADRFREIGDVNALGTSMRDAGLLRAEGPPSEPPEFDVPPPADRNAPPQARRGPRRKTRELSATDGLAVFKSEYPDPVFVIAGLLTVGLTLFCGRPKIGKSWFTLLLGLAVAQGRKFLDRFDVERSGRVTYLALEESAARTHRRLRKLISTPDATLQNLGFIYALDPLLAGGAAQVDEYLAANPSVLVVVDSLLSVLQASGKRDVLRSDYAEINVLRELAQKHGVALLVVHHSRKMGADNHVDAVAGTTGVTAAADAIWSLKRRAEGDALLEITGRDMEDRAVGLHFGSVPFGWGVTGEGAAAVMSEERREIVELLREDAPLSPAAIAGALGKNRVTVRRLVSKLAADGVIAKGSDHKYRLASLSSMNSVNRESEGTEGVV